MIRSVKEIRSGKYFVEIFDVLGLIYYKQVSRGWLYLDLPT